MGISFYLDPQLHQSPRAPPDCFGLNPGLLFHTPKILTCRELLKLGYSTFICHVKKKCVQTSNIAIYKYALSVTHPI